MEESRSHTDYDTVGKLIACCITKHIPFYACRYPRETFCHFGAQYNTLPLDGLHNGFRVVPFDVHSHTPSFTICPDRWAGDLSCLLDAPALPLGENMLVGDDVSRDEYLMQAQSLVELMREGRASKVVLSRTITRSYDTPEQLAEWYVRLCETYPHAYVFVVSYPGVCGWMGATPEVLLTSVTDGYETMALAGTRKAGIQGEWGEKERDEQQYVVQYIADKLQAQGLQAITTDTFTRVAAQVEHLCTTFHVAIAPDDELRDCLIATLHPTPAVAGTPADVAIDVINQKEPHDRRYYGGYVGEVEDGGKCHLFVNLRSMEFAAEQIRLYVGGGLTAQSVPADEWNETCAKAQTLLSVLT